MLVKTNHLTEEKKNAISCLLIISETQQCIQQFRTKIKNSFNIVDIRQKTQSDKLFRLYQPWERSLRSLKLQNSLE